MDVALSDIRDSFEGVIPSIVATLDEAGVPNVTYLSQVYYVDEEHVALSNQFFSKTAANVRATGSATVLVISGRTGNQHMLDVTFLRSETSGPFLARMAPRLDVMHRGHGGEAVMKLRAVDIYRVDECRFVAPVAPLAVLPPHQSRPRDNLGLTVQLLSEMNASSDAEALLDNTLEGLDRLFGFANTMVMIADEDRRKLSAIASRGYVRSGIGAEVDYGAGVIGVAAQSRQPIRISDLSRIQRYIDAVIAKRMEEKARIDLPSLAVPLSQMAIPMLCRSRMMGVLFVESAANFAFDNRDEEALSIIASQLAAGLMLAGAERPEAEIPENASVPVKTSGAAFACQFYPHDGSVFFGEDYVIRGVPGRLLHFFLTSFCETGRTRFSNREIRRNRSLALPDFKDNLETRLILLRRRLEERGGPVRILNPERGQVELVVEGMPQIELRED